jgi:hypothetical protein
VTLPDPADRTPARPVSHLDERRAKVLGAIQLVRAHSTATGSARSVLNVLATYANADGSSLWAGREKLERETGLSRSTLRRAIRRLEELGELETLEVGSGRRSTRYRITLSPPCGEPVEILNVPERERVQPEPAGGSIRPRRGVTVNPDRVLPGSTGGGVSYPDQCSTHAFVEDPPPCRRCQQTREANETARVELERAARERARLEALELARLEAEHLAAGRLPAQERAARAAAVRAQLRPRQ